MLASQSWQDKSGFKIFLQFFSTVAVLLVFSYYTDVPSDSEQMQRNTTNKYTASKN